MAKMIEGNPRAAGKKFAVVVSQFNDFITTALLTGCLVELRRCAVKDRDITVVRVPGALELPIAALKLAQKKHIAAVICLGAVIRGETYHFEVVAQGALRGISEVALLTQKPVIFGVLTTDTVQQAEARADLKKDNKGREAALCAVLTVTALAKI